MKKIVNTKFFCSTQNDSGGYYLLNEEEGIGHYIIVEGIDKEHIRSRLEKIIENFSDYCLCCGERWDTYILDTDLEDTPCVWNTSVEKLKENMQGNDKIVYVHFIDGTLKKFYWHTD